MNWGRDVQIPSKNLLKQIERKLHHRHRFGIFISENSVTRFFPETKKPDFYHFFVSSLFGII